MKVIHKLLECVLVFFLIIFCLALYPFVADELENMDDVEF